jgi:hypothetical protein
MHVVYTVSPRAALLLLSVAAALVLQVFTAAAQGLPRINIEASCRASAKAVADAIGDNTVATVENCINQENSARADILKNWNTFTPADRTQCINAKRYMPSYVEWLSCLETRKHLRTLPKQ